MTSSDAMTIATAYGLNIITAAVILIVGWWFSGKAAAAIRKMLRKAPWMDDTLLPLAGTVVKYTIIIITILAVLDRFGVETTSIIAVLGAAGLAIGLALQGTLSNVAAGVMLLVLRPFRVGDAIEVAGQAGTVKKIDLFTVELHSANNVFISIPNSTVWNSTIVNYSRNPTRRIDLTIGIGYDDDIDCAMKVLEDILSADERILSDPAPMTAVKALGESSVDLAVRAHTKTADYWAVQFELQKTIKQRFDAEKISIPYPQRDIHMIGEKAPAAKKTTTRRKTAASKKQA